MIRPRLITVLAFLAGVPLALAIVISNPSLWPLTLDYGSLVLLMAAIDGFAGPRARALSVEAVAPARIFVGESGALSLDVAFAALSRPLALEVLVEHSGPAPAPSALTCRVAAGEKARINVPIHPDRRGRIEIAAVWLRWSGPLRLTERLRRLPLALTIEVTPNVRGIHKTGLQFLAQDAMHGQKVERDKGEGAEFDSLRDYAPGMDHRFIDWKRSAKNRKLLCKEFRTERNHQIVLAFDTGHLMQEPVGGLTRLDHAINAGLLLAWVSLQCGDLVGAFAFDAAVRQFTPPRAGAPNFGRIQASLAGLAYHPFETNFVLGLAELNVRLKRRALVVLFTDFVDTVSAELLLDSLGLMANRHAVLFVTLRDQDFEALTDAPPASFESLAEAVIAHDFLQERAVVFERLRRLGVFCLDANVARLSVDLVNRYLAIKRKGALG